MTATRDGHRLRSHQNALSNSQEIEMCKLAFCLRGEIDKTTLHRKPRKKFAEHGRLNAYGAGGRKVPTFSVSPASSVFALAPEHHAGLVMTAALFKHVNSFTATCALPVHNVAAEGTRYDRTCKAHTHMADD